MTITTTINPNNINNPTKELLVGTSGQYGTDNPNQNGPNTPSSLTSSTTSTSTTTTANVNALSILPASGFYNNFQSAMTSGAVPEWLSSARWSDSDKGYPQQTFLGASIRGFNMQGGFGDSSSSLTVDLIVDEFNESDNTDVGAGDDVYHSGGFNTQIFYGDNFVPPIPGSPVFFKFGPNFATVEQAYRKTFDELYYYDTIDQKEPSTGGSTTLHDIIYGKFNLPNNSYVDLYLPDYEDGGPLANEFYNRTIVNYSNILNSENSRGKDHIIFGGILQTYTQNRSPAGNPLYTVNVVDPREILSNTILILNNYAGPTYEQTNILNVYGFLEYNATDDTKSSIKTIMPYENILKKTVKVTEPDMGSITFTGDDKYYAAPPANVDALKQTIKDLEQEISSAKRTISDYRLNSNFIGASALYDRIVSLSTTLRATKITLEQQKALSRPFFPITGTGYSRRSSQGIPYYRIQDAINSLMEYYTPLPQEYKNQGFGGKINFRGYNYVVDFGGLPSLPEFYFVDFDQINLLELALEICDITNRDLFVSLLPVIDHPACSNIYNYNKTASVQNMIAGIIRLDTINRSEQPFYGAIKTYIDSLAANKIYVENQDLGYELSNVVTDKFIVGAQEIDMYYFSSNADRDSIAVRKTGLNNTFPNKSAGYQWTLEASLEQQILPYYGKLGNNAITIPKGFGAYQQILLDSSSLNAGGVGAYYVTTEMELRCALISFDRWKDFLQTYNDIYMESIESDDPSDRAIAGMTPNPDPSKDPPVLDISSKYAVTVPRSVFDTYVLGNPYGQDGLPISPCNPPYGYPLYYKRMTRIGIPEGGLTNLFTKWTALNTNLAELTNADPKDIKGILNSQYQNLKRAAPLTDFEKRYYDELEKILKDPTPKAIQDSIGFLEGIVQGNGRNMFAILPSIAKKNLKNALKVYEFVRGVAEECLGKKFLVKIPTEVNLFYENNITWDNDTNQEYKQGPFGFRPRSTRNIPGYEFTSEFKQQVENARGNITNKNIIQSFLSPDINSGPNPTSFIGALRANYNPISEKYESNYTPMNIGGYFPFDLYQNTLNASTIQNISNANFNKLPIGVQQGLIPQDLTNFINEDGRISPYVRFDNSENLTLEGFNDSDFTQQFSVGNAMIPDLSQALDNTGKDEFHSFQNTDQQQNDNVAPKPKQTAFVKCNVDEQLYYPPKFAVRQTKVHGQNVKDIGTKSIPQKIFIPCSGLENNTFVEGSGVYIDSFSFYQANYVPVPGGGTSVKILDFQRYNPFLNVPGGTQLNNSEYVQAESDQLNTEHVYALITLPNRILPTQDSRFRDGHFQSINTEKYKHLMTMDVVRGLAGFDIPSTMDTPPIGNLKPTDLNIPIDKKIQAWFAMKKVHAALSFGFPQQVNLTMPSPVYPDLVALPLMSNDRCYGPWISSQLDGQAYLLKNIGGKVEFIKDENLSPWNYGGYHLLNEAGRLQAEFSNSLLLFSERGSFTIPALPKGNSLCRALLNGGPLVTSIAVDVADGGAKTTYQMDLYTASFGKLQKQKQEEISKISRERKKITSERNALIRKGLGKNQSARNFANEYNMMSNGVVPGLNEMGLGLANAMTNLVASVDSETRKKWSSSLQNFGSNGDSSSIPVKEYYIGGSLQSSTQLGKTAQNFPDESSMAKSYQNSADRPLIGNDSNNPIFTPMSNGYHANMAYRPNSNIDALEHLYFLDNEDLENDFRDQITKYGDNA